MKQDKITFELTVEEINLILDALGRLPFINVFALIENLKNQYDKQNKEKEEAD